MSIRSLFLVPAFFLALLLTGCDDLSNDDADLLVEGNGIAINDGHFLANILDGSFFGEATVGGQGVERDFTVTNQGTGNFEFRGQNPIRILGGDEDDFTVVATLPEVLEPRQTATVRLRFNPQAVGKRTSIVSFGYRRSAEANDATQDFSFRIVGEGASSGSLQISSTLSGSVLSNGSDVIAEDLGTDLGTAVAGEESTTSSFTISNTASSGSLDISLPVKIEGPHAADFTLIAVPAGSVAAGNSTSFIVSFSPRDGVTGQRQAVVVINSSDSVQSDFQFMIQGEAIPASDS